jgi:hypothetical protein
VLTKRDENQLLVFEIKVLRTIYGPKIENGVYGRRYNHELKKEFNSPNPNALNFTKTSRLRYAGHMIRHYHKRLYSEPYKPYPSEIIVQNSIKKIQILKNFLQKR